MEFSCTFQADKIPLITITGIKGGSRDKKIKLIEDLNPDWNDLYDTLD